MEGAVSFALQEKEFKRLKESRMINFWPAAEHIRDMNGARTGFGDLERGSSAGRANTGLR